MSETIKILWIEDEANSGLVEIKVYLEMQGFDLYVAGNATEAAEKFTGQDAFDIIITDIRILPGLSKDWERLYYENNRVNERLGINIIKIFLQQHSALTEKLAVFSIERWEDIRDALQEAGFFGKDSETLAKKRYFGKQEYDMPEDIENFIYTVLGKENSSSL